MAEGVDMKVSTASARSHAREPDHKSPISIPPSMMKNILLVFLVGFLAFAYQSIRPPPPKICGSPGGPPVTAPRVKLSDGRQLQVCRRRKHQEYKFIFVHGFDSCGNHAVVATELSREIVESMGIYIVSFDRPGYGESDPNPKRTVKSIVMDVEELADLLGLGGNFM